jgi:predicted nicotinamide N-methyase
VSRFPAELTVTLTDGRTVTECFNQAEMAQFMRANMMECLSRGEPLVVFDGERQEIPAEKVASVQVIVQELVHV